MGKGGGALSAWLKEFTALVFTQTIQAFIYAIIISIILFGMVKTDENMSGDDKNAALGLMSTFALLSVFKVEELSKKIFGVGDTKASPGNAMKSIAKTAIAAKLGSRVLNNAGKVLGGVKKINKSRQDNKKTKERLNEDMEDNGFVKNKDGKYEYVGTQKTKQNSGSSSVFASSSIDGSGGGAGGNSGVGAESSSGGGENFSGGESTAAMSDAAQRRMRNALRSYDDKLSEIKKARDEGIKDIASGITESIGATFGATAGGILGGADGNLDELLQGIMAGAGAGDIVGKSTVEAVDRAVQFAQRNINRKAGISSKELQRSLKAAKDAVAATQKEYGSVEDAND